MSKKKKYQLAKEAVFAHLEKYETLYGREYDNLPADKRALYGNLKGILRAIYNEIVAIEKDRIKVPLSYRDAETMPGTRYDQTPKCRACRYFDINVGDEKGRSLCLRFNFMVFTYKVCNHFIAFKKD